MNCATLNYDVAWFYFAKKYGAAFFPYALRLKWRILSEEQGEIVTAVVS